VKEAHSLKDMQLSMIKRRMSNIIHLETILHQVVATDFKFLTLPCLSMEFWDLSMVILNLIQMCSLFGKDNSETLPMELKLLLITLLHLENPNGMYHLVW